MSPIGWKDTMSPGHFSTWAKCLRDGLYGFRSRFLAVCASELGVVACVYLVNQFSFLSLEMNYSAHDDFMSATKLSDKSARVCDMVRFNIL